MAVYCSKEVQSAVEHPIRYNDDELPLVINPRYGAKEICVSNKLMPFATASGF